MWFKARYPSIRQFFLYPVHPYYLNRRKLPILIQLRTVELQGENMSVSLSNLKRGMHVVSAACDKVHDTYLQQGHMRWKKQLLFFF